MSGGQLLASAVVVLIVNSDQLLPDLLGARQRWARRRAQRTSGRRPDFQFPQDDNPHARDARLEAESRDYLYVALTNSIAFSPTDTMPLTHKAKLFMSFESVIARSPSSSWLRAP